MKFFFGTDDLDVRNWAADYGGLKELKKTLEDQFDHTLLVAQDVLFQRALEANADTSAIVAEKQRLRDITNLADACVTTDELRALKAENR